MCAAPVSALSHFSSAAAAGGGFSDIRWTKEISDYYKVLHDPHIKHEVKEALYMSFSKEERARLVPPLRGKLGRELGAHFNRERNGTEFKVHAPCAARVFTVITYGGKDTKRIELVKNPHTGYWESFEWGARPGTTYHYEIHTTYGHVLKKIDPFALENWPYTEGDFRYESVVRVRDKLDWHDESWMRARADCVGKKLPMNIYKVHVLTWKPEITSYRKLAEELVGHCKYMGYTHVELSGIMEHPSVDSKGYQPLSLMAPTSRLGSVEDFQYFVDHLHTNGIGVGIDFVSNHFAVDSFGLHHFDGSAVFDYEGEAKEWGAYKFNPKSDFSRNYIASAANSWADVFHIDFFRFDAVDCILHSEREAGSYLLRTVNEYLHQSYPGVLTFAESSAYSHEVTCSSASGLGFDGQQDLGRQHDLQRYLKTDPLYRVYHHEDLTKAVSAIAGSAVNTLSHDSDLRPDTMPGDEWRKFANLRILRCLQMTIPGRKLTYMSHDIGSNRDGPLEWHKLDAPLHRGLFDMAARLNHLYRKYAELWDDNELSSLRWIDTKDKTNSVISFHRGNLACVFNMTPSYFSDYEIYFPDETRAGVTSMKEVFSSDEAAFGGSGKTNSSVHLIRDRGKTIGFKIKLPPLGCTLLEETF